jgi:hypothetical protein
MGFKVSPTEQLGASTGSLDHPLTFRHGKRAVLFRKVTRFFDPVERANVIFFRFEELSAAQGVKFMAR